MDLFANEKRLSFCPLFVLPLSCLDFFLSCHCGMLVLSFDCHLSLSSSMPSCMSSCLSLSLSYQGASGEGIDPDVWQRLAALVTG